MHKTRNVRIALYLIWIYFFVGIIQSLSYLSAMEDRDFRNDAFWIFVIFFIFLIIINVYIAKGRNWAKFLLFAVYMYNFSHNYKSLFNATLLDLFAILVTWGIPIAILILLNTKSSNEWFEFKKLERKKGNKISQN